MFSLPHGEAYTYAAEAIGDCAFPFLGDPGQLNLQLIPNIRPN
jgi:hypothetical protein